MHSKTLKGGTKCASELSNPLQIIQFPFNTSIHWKKDHIERLTNTHSGTCAIKNAITDSVTHTTFERGSILTGKQRVFSGLYISITIGSKKIIGKSHGAQESYQAALHDCNRQLQAIDMILLAAGNLDDYSESGLSASSGMGYINNSGPVDIMSLPPTEYLDA